MGWWQTIVLFLIDLVLRLTLYSFHSLHLIFWNVLWKLATAKVIFVFFSHTTFDTLGHNLFASPGLQEIGQTQLLGRKLFSIFSSLTKIVKIKLFCLLITGTNKNKPVLNPLIMNEHSFCCCCSFSFFMPHKIFNCDMMT